MRRAIAVAVVAILAIGLVVGTASATGDESDIQIGDNYIVLGPPMELWKETNGVPGLQRHWHCVARDGTLYDLPCREGDGTVAPDSPGIKVP